MDRRRFLGLAASAASVSAAAGLIYPWRDYFLNAWQDRVFVAEKLSVEEYEAHFEKIWGQLTTREVPGRNAAYSRFKFGQEEPFVGSVVLIKGLRAADVSSVNSLHFPEKHPLSEEPSAKTILYTLNPNYSDSTPDLQLTVSKWDGQDPKRFGASREKRFQYVLNASERSYVIDQVLKALNEKKEETTFKPKIFAV